MTDFDKGRTRSRNRMGVVVTVLVMAVVFSLLALKTTRADSIPTYYIAPNGSDSNDGSSANPYKTFAKALTRITDKQGGTIYFKGSTDESNPYVYQEQIIINKSGKDSNNSLIVGGEPGKYAAIDGKNHTIPSSQWAGLIKPEGNYLRIINLEVRSSGGDCIKTDKFVNNKPVWFKHITVTNCRMHHCRNAGIRLRRTDYPIIEKCEVWHCNDDEGHPHPNGMGIHDSTNATIRNNHVHHTFTEGIEMRGTIKGIVENNIIHQTRNGSLLIDRCQDVVVQRNFIFSDPADPGGVFREPGFPSNGITLAIQGGKAWNKISQNNKIINNIVVHQFKGFQVTPYGKHLGTGGLVNCLIANNTFVDMYHNVDGNAGGGAGFHINTKNGEIEIRNSEIRNNVIIQYRYKGVLHRGETSGITWSNNCWDDGSGGKPTAGAKGVGDVYDEAGLLEAAHAFVNGKANVDWYKLSSNSKCKDAGADIASITEDYWRNSRPYGNKYDVGAHEFGGTSSPTNPPTGTTLIFSFKPEGMVNPPSLLGTKVEAIKDGQGTPQVITASYLTDGEYEGEISGLSLGTYTVIVKPERHLSEKFEGISITEGSNEYDFTDTQYGARFLAGDISGADGSPNNKVDIYDIALVVNDFDEEGDAADLTADVDYDGIVGGLDLTYIISSFDEEGE